MDPNNEVNQNIASAYLEMLALEEKKKIGKHKMPDGSMMRDDDPSMSEKKKIGKHKMPDGSMMRDDDPSMSEDNTNDKSDDGEGLDKVQPKALKKKFKDRKDKDIDNDGDVDKSDEYLDNRRKTVSKAIDKDGEVDQDKPKVTSSDADSEKDNDDDRDEKGSVLKKDNDKKKTTEQTKEDMIPLDRQRELDRRAMVKIIKTKDNKWQVQRMTKGKFVNQGKPYKSLKQAEKERSGVLSSMQFEENLKELGLEILDKMSEAKKTVSQMTPKEKEDDAARRKEYNAYQKSKRGGTKEEGIIDRLLAGKPKGGSKHWVTKKKNTKESVEPSLLMKRILDEKRVGDAEQNIDTWDKQVSNRRADDVLDTEITEKEFMDMHNVDTPEFVDGPKVSNKTMDAIKNSVKSKSATRNNDSTIGESVQLEGNRITLPLSPEDKKLVSKMYNKDGTLTAIGKRLMNHVKKESVELENVNEALIDNLGDELPYFIDRRKGAETDWYSNINRTMKMLESDLKDRKNLHLRAARPYRDVSGHHDASLKAIADVRSKLKDVVKAFDKAFYEANAVDREIIRADKAASKKAVRK